MDEPPSANLPTQDPWFEVTQLSPSLFRITEPRCHRWVRANCFLILGGERDIVVDSGMGIAALRPIIDRSSSRPRLIFTTHAHVDHVGSHPEFADCEILIHPAEAADLARPGQRGLLFPERSAAEVEALRGSGIDPTRRMIDAIPFVGYNTESYQRAPVGSTRLVSEGDVVETGDREFQGSICPAILREALRSGSLPAARSFRATRSMTASSSTTSPGRTWGFIVRQ
jgi:glyoxylase-like metal-dependent hydrolase (beta-lactamase superfamily II)